MMASDERKVASSPLIPLEIDPASILSLSKGVIFDTIVHNIEYTLNNRRTEPLPWKLIGMSLICDSSRNKKYMQKLQKMQCVPSVICTQIYHSKLVKTESGVLTTPGRKIVISSVLRKRLTGIIVCRSIDELLFMESSNTENVHFIQYKLLSYERIATRELVNGPKLSSVGDKIIKTVFDFELTQNNGFPRQLLPVAIISFTRQDGCDLCLSIRNFLKLDEHKIFDKSYLVTSINVEFDRLREEQERKEDAEAEQELISEKIQRRQPLADLSKKSTDTGNARPLSIPQPPLRVPPIKIKFPRPEKPVKPSVSLPLPDPKFRCLIKMDRIDLSLYDISNLPLSSEVKTKKSSESPTLSDSINNKTKLFVITKPHEHHKPLKRLNTSEPKKQSSSSSSESFKEKRRHESISASSSTSDVAISLPKKKRNGRSISSSTMSPIYRPKPIVQKRLVEKTVIKKKVKRPALSSDYHCSIPITRIDLSMYDVDLSSIPTSISTLPMDITSTVSSSPSSSTSSEQKIEPRDVSVESIHIHDTIQSICMMEQETIHETEEENIFDTQQFVDTNTNQTLSNIIDEFLTPDLNEPLSNTNNDVLPLFTDEILPQATNEPLPNNSNEIPPQTIDEPASAVVTEVLPLPMNGIVSVVVTETTSILLPTVHDNISSTATNEAVPVISNEENAGPSSAYSPCVAFSPDLPPLDDDPVLFSIESPQVPVTDALNMLPQDYIIIVPCSDDDDDIDDDEEQVNDTKSNIVTNNTPTKLVEASSSPLKNYTCPSLLNPSLSRVVTYTSRLKSHRLSTSSSSSCSSISISILHNQSPRSPLHLTEILISQKILNKKLYKSNQPINLNRFDVCIPLIAQEPLIDPRLIYRLQSITTDLRWPSPCSQCSISSCLPSLFTSSTQMILYDRKHPSDFVDPRRESLKSAILNNLYQRIKILIPNIFVINSNQFQKLLFEQTIFKTNCSLHLEYLLHKTKVIDDMNFFHMIKTNEEFQLSPFLLQLIFN